MKVRNLCRSLAKRLGMVAVAGSMSLGLASDGFAARVPVYDPGFEDHIVDHSSGYAYGAAGQAGDPDGFNNPSSANGGVSPWQALASGGNGIGGDNASWIQNSGYATPNSGDQSAEVQGVFAQNLVAAVIPNMQYVATVAAKAVGTDQLVVSLYDAGAVTFLPTSTPDLILTEPSLVTATPVNTSDDWADETFVFSAASVAHLVGKNIGIAVYEPDATGQGPHIDDIRLAVRIPEPGSLALLGLGGVVLAGLRRRE